MLLSAGVLRSSYPSYPSCPSCPSYPSYPSYSSLLSPGEVAMGASVNLLSFGRQKGGEGVF